MNCDESAKQKLKDKCNKNARMKYGSRDKIRFEICNSPLPNVKQVTNAIQTESVRNTKNFMPLQNNGSCYLCFQDLQPSINNGN